MASLSSGNITNYKNSCQTILHHTLLRDGLHEIDFFVRLCASSTTRSVSATFIIVRDHVRNVGESIERIFDRDLPDDLTLLS